MAWGFGAWVSGLGGWSLGFGVFGFLRFVVESFRVVPANPKSISF